MLSPIAGEARWVSAGWLTTLRLEKREWSSQREPETALYIRGAGWATRALARRLVLPSCTALPLAARALFTRSPANQRGRSGAWTRCAPGGENGCCAPLPRRREGAEGCGAVSLGSRRKEDLADPKNVSRASGLRKAGADDSGRGAVFEGKRRTCFGGISCLALARRINLEAPVYSRPTNR